MKYSKQRDSIKNFLMTRNDHPTAETIYTSLRREMPSLSLGTVYRNLTLLADMGEINRISTGNGPDHYDGITAPHTHVVCRQCGKIFDVYMESISRIDEIAAEHFDGVIEEHVLYFQGICSGCLKTGTAGDADPEPEGEAAPAAECTNDNRQIGF